MSEHESAERAQFIRMADAHREEWMIIGRSMWPYQQQLPDRVRGSEHPLQTNEHTTRTVLRHILDVGDVLGHLHREHEIEVLTGTHSSLSLTNGTHAIKVSCVRR